MEMKKEEQAGCGDVCRRRMYVVMSQNQGSQRKVGFESSGFYMDGFSIPCAGQKSHDVHIIRFFFRGRGAMVTSGHMMTGQDVRSVRGNGGKNDPPCFMLSMKILELSGPRETGG